MKKNIHSFVINLSLFIFGIATIFSGMTIHAKFHMGNHGNIIKNDLVLGLTYKNWSAAHKVSIVVLSFLMIYHIYQHWKWYKVILVKKLIFKNIQVLTLSLLFILVANTGLTPWLINLMDGNGFVRKVIIEIHDKLAIILTIYLFLHIIKRLRWFFITFEKIKNT